MDLSSYVNKNVTISVNHELYITGKLTNHAHCLFQVTGRDNHFVFWEHDVIAYSLEDSNNHLTIFI